jgi:hypothetical protein
MASIIKADNIQKVSDGSNIIKKCGSTITLGSCGATIALACGATQTGFGRTGTVDWCTTAKTAPFTGVSGNGYFVNTTCGAVTVTLPATPTAGDIISIADYASRWNLNNVTLCNNSSKINGACGIAVLNTEGQSITLVYVDGTRGWKNTMDSTSDVSGIPTYIVATGGTESYCGDYKIHTFTSDATFTICTAPTPANNVVDYLVVAGGGGSGGYGGGGGAGGVRASATTYAIGCNPAGPLVACVSALPVSIQTYPITVGAGAASVIPNPLGYQAGFAGSPSTFSTITSAGGGGGGYYDNFPGNNGASGGGGGSSESAGSTPGGSGNTPPVSPPQGNNGGSGRQNCGGYLGGGGGGGAIVAGSTPAPTGGEGNGGDGAGFTNNAFGSSNGECSSGVQYFGGGGGGNPGSKPGFTPSTGGLGGGADGPDIGGIINGTANTGGGGGGSNESSNSAGGSGIVIIRYKYQ